MSFRRTILRLITFGAYKGRRPLEVLAEQAREQGAESVVERRQHSQHEVAEAAAEVQRVAEETIVALSEQAP